MKQGWTREPWTLEGEGKLADSGHVWCDRRLVAACNGYQDGREITTKENDANAARIVACVNAMSGVEDPAAFVVDVREVVHILSETTLIKSALDLLCRHVPPYLNAICEECDGNGYQDYDDGDSRGQPTCETCRGRGRVHLPETKPIHCGDGHHLRDSDFVDGVTCDDVREMERRMIEEHLADAAKEESLDANPED